MQRYILTALTIIICAACSKAVEPIHQAAQVASPTQMQQCGKDTDCKGDRICHSGQCVNPNGVQTSTAGQVAPAEQNTATPVATTQDSAPLKFKDYPAGPLYTGPAAKLVLNNDLAKDYRTRLREVLSDEPVFAGEYVSASWGCGTSCGITAFVSKRTGKALEETFGGEFGPHLSEARIDSKLIVAEGPVLDKDYNDTGSYAAYFYALEDGELKLIRTIPIQRPADANHDGLPDDPEAILGDIPIEHESDARVPTAAMSTSTNASGGIEAASNASFERFGVNFGAYASEPDAIAVRSRAQLSGLPSFHLLTSINGKNAWRVAIGPFSERTQAATARIEALKIRSDVKAAIISLPHTYGTQDSVIE